MKSLIRPLRYDKQVTFMLKEEVYKKLCEISKDKGYGTHHENLKQPKTGVARLIREIVEDWLNKK